MAASLALRAPPAIAFANSNRTSFSKSALAAACTAVTLSKLWHNFGSTLDVGRRCSKFRRSSTCTFRLTCVRVHGSSGSRCLPVYQVLPGCLHSATGACSQQQACPLALMIALAQPHPASLAPLESGRLAADSAQVLQGQLCWQLLQCQWQCQPRVLTHADQGWLLRLQAASLEGKDWVGTEAASLLALGTAAAMGCRLAAHCPTAPPHLHRHQIPGKYAAKHALPKAIAVSHMLTEMAILLLTTKTIRNR